MTLNQFADELNLARTINATNDIFGVEYYSASNRSVRNYVMFKTEQEFSSWKQSLKDWDFVINKLAI
jgi:hypothetical protein